MIIEICGAPKSGKTQMATYIEEHAKHDGFRIRHYHGGGRFIPMDGKNSPEFNLAAVARNLYYLLTAPKPDNTVTIMDRGVVDALIFTEAQLDCEIISRTERDAIVNFIDQPPVWRKMDHIVVLSAHSDVIQNRWKYSVGPNRGKHPGNLELKLALNNRYNEIEKILNTRSVRYTIVEVPSNHQELLESSEEVYRRILSSTIEEMI
ncbi:MULTISPECIES: hypothetical protein [Rhodococcus]|uniref:hypothetical protein n=1 Tax=Rhodococcus TaxID=1827 RepID=UPI0008061AEA|nr:MULTISPECIES: hypothetical protein [Rhodococcus]ANQ73277.1 hypothetical protein AOT96_22310 [Rhodococcus sp. 008]MCZ4546186.1 hypothetical protein [Rhodococcus qingshengii]UGQ53333.1 AAA family ATPase [Rhodococcus qingshengii]